MLQFHYRQLARTTTHEAMAAEMGWKDSAAANAHYGKLGRRVGERLGWFPDPRLPIKVLVHIRRGPQGECRWKMRGRLAAALEELGWVTKRPPTDTGGMESRGKTEFIEGSLRRMAVNAYERNPEAREACLVHYGTSCMLCGFNFGKAYGPAAEGFIHVHHTVMVKEKGGKKYEIDPIRDLRPVCPNCHSVIHIKAKPYAIREVREMVTKHRRTGWLDPAEVREARLRQPPIRFSRMTPKQA
jgi:predicted HNH restriction endonuclease